MTDASSSSYPGRALVIGISAYPDGQALPPAVRNDARDIAQALSDPAVSSYPPDRVTVLLDEQATATAIRTNLETLVRTSRLGETVVIYFSGHGVRSPVPGLLAVDIDPQTGRPAVITREALSAALARIVSDRLLLILDACYSGGAAVLKGEQDQAASGAEIASLFEGRGRAVYASSSDRQPAAVLNGHRNSLFTGELLKALRGDAFGDGDNIGVLELFTTASAATRKVRPEQTPMLLAALSDNFPVALRPRTRSDVGLDSEPLAGDLWEVFAELYPLGPQDQHIWARAGGDLSRISLAGPGGSQWFAALRTLELGGGGTTRAALLSAALRDYPRHPALMRP